MEHIVRFDVNNKYIRIRTFRKFLKCSDNI